MHLRLFEAAKNALRHRGIHVIGGVVSPVNDAYGKPGLLSAEHRLSMAHKAVDSSSWIQVDEWEAKQTEYQRTLIVLEHIKSVVHESHPQARIMLLCGGDLLYSFAKPGVWKLDQLETLITQYGVVAIERKGVDPREAILQSSMLSKLRSHIIIDSDSAITNTISSSAVRSLVLSGDSIRYLVPDSVVEYIEENNLYRE